jgi:hypothetical protein
MDPAQPTARSPRRARMSTENAHVTGELPVVGYVGRHRAKVTTRPEHLAAKLVGRFR